MSAGTGGAGIEAGECEGELSAMLEIMIMIMIVEPERPRGFRPVGWGSPAECIRRTDRKRENSEQQRCQRQMPLLACVDA